MNQKSGFVDIRVTRLYFDKKKIKNGGHDRDIISNFLKNRCSLGINNNMQYFEY